MWVIETRILSGEVWDTWLPDFSLGMVGEVFQRRVWRWWAGMSRIQCFIVQMCYLTALYFLDFVLIFVVTLVGIALQVDQSFVGVFLLYLLSRSVFVGLYFLSLYLWGLPFG